MIKEENPVRVPDQVQMSRRNDCRASTGLVPQYFTKSNSQNILSKEKAQNNIKNYLANLASDILVTSRRQQQPGLPQIVMEHRGQSIGIPSFSPLN